MTENEAMLPDAFSASCNGGYPCIHVYSTSWWIWVLDAATTESKMVTGFGAVMVHDAALVSCGDCIELAVPYSLHVYTILCNWLQTLLCISVDAVQNATCWTEHSRPLLAHWCAWLWDSIVSLQVKGPLMNVLSLN